jgi:hypothetical protein
MLLKPIITAITASSMVHIVGYPDATRRQT